MGQIIAFPQTDRGPARLTVRDRIAMFRWEAAEQEAGRLGKIALHEDVPCEADERVDFVLFYAPDRCWADWGLARAAGGIVIWSCGDGAQIGPFAAIEDALETLGQRIGRAKRARPGAARRAVALRAASLAGADIASGADGAA